MADNNDAQDLSTGKEYELKAKRAYVDKWWTYARLKVNPWGKWTVGLKVTDELLELVNSMVKGQYIYFSVYENDRAGNDQQSPHNKAKANAYQPEPAELSDEIPW